MDAAGFGGGGFGQDYAVALFSVAADGRGNKPRILRAAGAQKRTGDFFGAQSLNDSKRGTPRTMQYHPDGRDFVCVNGKNLYTRALYGGPADYRVEKVADDKIKDSEVTLELTKNPDIAKAVGKVKGDKKLVVFCAEKRELIERATGKLKSKNADMVVANDVTKEGAGFDVDTNIATLITKDGKVRDCELMTKAALADVILDELIAL